MIKEESRGSEIITAMSDAQRRGLVEAYIDASHNDWKEVPASLTDIGYPPPQCC